MKGSCRLRIRGDSYRVRYVSRHEEVEYARSGVDVSLGENWNTRLADGPIGNTLSTASELAGGAAELARWDTLAITVDLPDRAADAPCYDTHTIATGETGGAACTP